MTEFMKGLSIFFWGWGVSFVAMAVFMGLILLLRKIFPYKELEVEVVDKVEAEETVVVEAEIANEDEEIVAAIAAAIGHLRARSQNNLGSSLESGRGKWWLTNRLSSRETNPLRK